MRILFDPDFDLGAWPGPRGDAEAVAGAAWLGPQGFLAALESQLGLDVPHASAADRAAALVPRIFREDRFYGASGRAAPWSTAQRLLEWRDHLWEHGWRGEGLGQRRLGELAEVTLDLPPGRPERLEAVAGWLASRAADVEAVRLIVPRASLSLGWRSVLDALERRGARVEEAIPSPAPAADRNLQLVRPHGPRQGARDLAEALAADPGLGETVFVGPDGVLDEALAAFSLPTLGAPSSHADGALAALLPLTLALALSPIDPQVARQWLTLPDLPLPREVARRLAETLGAWPAAGNPLWQEVAAEAAQGEGGAAIRAAIETVFTPLTSRDRAVRARDLLPRIDLVARWAEGRAEESAAHAGVLAQARTLRRRFQVAEVHRLAPPQLDAVVASVAGGGNAPQRPACAGYASVGLPGGVAGPARRVIWWGFLDGGSPRRARVMLREAERRALSSVGVVLPSLGEEVHAAAARARRPLDFATEALILVAPRHDEAGEPAHPHPLWDDIVSQLADPHDTRHLVRDRPALPRAPRRANVAAASRALAPWTWQAARGLPPRPAESPTSLAKLIGCPFAYALEYEGRLRPRAEARLPADGQLHGRLAHEVLAALARSGQLAREGSDEAAREALDRLLSTHAAELLLPGHDPDLVLLRESLGGAASLLGRVVAEEGLRVHAAERELSADLGGRALRGTPDLVLEDPAGRLVLLDFKWSGESFHREALRAGTALQLAAYARLLAAAGREVRTVGYLVLRSRRLLVRGHPLALAQTVGADLLAATWTTAERSWSERALELARGEIRAEGVPAPCRDPVPRPALAGGRLLLPPPCDRCPLDLLCGRGEAPP